MYVLDLREHMTLILDKVMRFPLILWPSEYVPQSFSDVPGSIRWQCDSG